MDVADEGDAVGHCPLDRAEIVGEHGGRAERAQSCAKAPDVADRVPLADLDEGRLHVESGIEPIAGGKVPVHGDDRVPPCRTEMVGQRREPDLRPADGEGGKDREKERGAQNWK